MRVDAFAKSSFDAVLKKVVYFGLGASVLVACIVLFWQALYKVVLMMFCCRVLLRMSLYVILSSPVQRD
jgi:hypothetical protein